MRKILILAGVYNIAGGFTIIFLLDFVAPLLDFHDQGNMLFRLFAGGTAVAFGLGYLSASRNYEENRPIVYYGTGIKYWAFLVSLYCYVAHHLSAQVLLGFGGVNFVFALLFTRFFLLRPARSSG